MSKLRALDLALAAMFVALMAIGANITSWAPFLQVAGVPLSMQPFFAILAGLLLGSRLGALSMIVYTLVGIAGAPIFAGFKAGFSQLLSPTGGFIIAFIIVAYVTGKIVEQVKKPKFGTFATASAVGIILTYVIGTTYMYLAINYWMGGHISYVAAWKIMMWFAVKDIIFTIIGAVIAPRIYYAVRRSAYQSSRFAS
ncbi:biotin transporter BioY [Bacillus multifaciens]|uniref:biotin transporter BioY n=1 Tax=Bacillus multifaciens TaxID=3068506 RepID=UPI002741B1CF|nr:biotin transporter BioY [Bacillus sp. WLY-B-L8]MDP7979298.1 biotin transporter BioY [Bacillus sp. WLY-B-L8]HDX9589654.1 biotin transporter BioY [Bacillus pseudomycoides]